MVSLLLYALVFSCSVALSLIENFFIEYKDQLTSGSEVSLPEPGIAMRKCLLHAFDAVPVCCVTQDIALEGGYSGFWPFSTMGQWDNGV